MRRKVLALTLLALSLGIYGGCSLIAESDIDGKGIGARCSSDDDCHGSKCDPQKGICTLSCGSSGDCPTGSQCLGGSCDVPQKVGALYVGVAAVDEGWTLTHDTALRQMPAQLPWMDRFISKDLVSPGSVGPAIEELIGQGAGIVIATSFSHAAEVRDAAGKHPDVKFLTCSGNIHNDSNLGSYWGRIEQAWYVAGRFAARNATTRIGYLGSFITPEIVRHLNAFTLGAQHEKPDVKVEIRWLGFWFDHYALGGKLVPCKYGKDGQCTREELETERLIESGAEVIAHQVDNGLPVRFIDAYNKNHKPAGKPDVLSIGNDVQWACHAGNTEAGATIPSCIFAVHWNWAPMYRKLLADVHYGSWQSSVVVNENITTDPSSVAGVQATAGGPVSDSQLKTLLNEVAGDAGKSRAFEGPWETTGQREPMPAGQRPSDDEIATMCYAVRGIVEKTDPADPLSADRDAFIPDDMHPAPGTAIGPPGAPDSVAHNCKENGPPKP
jgi:basic membrane protein A and related proteins